MFWKHPECGHLSADCFVFCWECSYTQDVLRIRPDWEETEIAEIVVSNSYFRRYNNLDYLLGIKTGDFKVAVCSKCGNSHQLIVEGKCLDCKTRMNPQEKLFADFFFNEKHVVIKDMNDIDLRLHREVLANIAFEARARLTAVDAEERERRSKEKGIKANVLVDGELTTNAINSITERTVKLSKREKLIKGLMDKVGVDRATAEAMVPDVEKTSTLGRAGDSEKKLKAINAGIQVKTESEERKEAKEFKNPFAPASQQNKPDVQVTIIEETNAVIVTETKAETKAEEVKSVFFNPFAK